MRLPRNPPRASARGVPWIARGRRGRHDAAELTLIARVNFTSLANMATVLLWTKRAHVRASVGHLELISAVPWPTLRHFYCGRSKI
eukprot:8690788-Pyramimonas_sp.AAC.1